MCASAWNCAPDRFGCTGRHERKCHFQAKFEYILTASKPQRICTETDFSQSLVQLGGKKKIAEKTTLQLPSGCASIGNVH
jgi:hypothetical protein